VLFRAAILFLRALLCAMGLIATDAAAAEITGTVRDTTGGALVNSRVTILTAQRAVVSTTTTDQDGKFRISGLPDGEYVAVAQYPPLAEQQRALKVSGTTPVAIDFVLDAVTSSETVSVSARPGGITELDRTTQPINVISADEVTLRAKTVVAQAVEGEVGVHVQRTSPGMAGIFVRGLTGNKVNVFLDGVRFSNGAQRGGVNTFLDLIDPSVVDTIEVLRGTSSAQYGSDALGGSVQFLSHVPVLAGNRPRAVSGSIAIGGETAHRGGFGAGTLNYSQGGFGLFGTFTGRKTGEYRPGGGTDTHSAFTRFFGLPSDLFLGERMPETGFHQTAAQVRANWVVRPDTLVTASYVSSRQDGANRWDQILGGDGNLIAELNDLQLDLAYVRLETLRAGWFDRASATYSFNTQREERVNQGGQGDPNAAIVHQPERTSVNGLQANASRRLNARQSLLIGGDFYFEGHDSSSFDVNPTSGAQTISRPRVPDAATYKQGGVFAQTDIDLNPRLTVVGAARAGFNRYRASQADAPIVNGRALWPDDGLSTSHATFRAGASFVATPSVVLTGSVSTGYRAPHMTDLGTLGLTGSGFEVAAPDVAGLNGQVGTTADATAVSTGRAVEQLTAETSVNWEGGIRVNTGRVRASADLFANTIDGNIQKQALILPSGAVGTLLGGQPITSQNANGVVFVALSTAPVLVRANFDRARVWGFEAEGDASIGGPVAVGGTFTYLEAEDLDRSVPPNIEGGTPAAGGIVWARVAPKGARWWVQPYSLFAATQSRLSSLDASDRRTGAARTRGQIQNFFRRGATVRGYVDAGADRIYGNADDILKATGETLAQIQDRVLGVGVNSSPLWTEVPSYALLGVRVGLRFGTQSIVIDAENLTDESYRGISWGMDGAGRGVSVRYSATF
jgi:outer membrane receptor protein involved in Fe transport